MLGPTSKVCTGCGETLPLEAFPPSRRGLHGRNSRCRPCRNKQGRESRAANLVERQERAVWQNLKSRYNLTRERYESLLASQNNRCAACGSDDPGRDNKMFAVDHDHRCCPGNRSCGECIRGLLCIWCNLGLGHFRDNVAAVEGALIYLKKWEDARESPGLG